MKRIQIERKKWKDKNAKNTKKERKKKEMERYE